MKRLLKVAEVAELLQCSHSNVYSAVAQGELHCTRVGAGKAGLRFTEEMVQEFIRRRTTGSGQALPAPAPETPTPGAFAVLDTEKLRRAWKEQGAL